MAPPNFMDDDRFDGLYMNVANTAKGIEPLLDTVFSFLRRKTDFFTGPPDGQGGGHASGSDKAGHKVMEILQKHAALHQQQQQQQKSTGNKVHKAKAPKQKKEATTPKTKKKEAEVDDVIELGEDGFDISEAVDIKEAKSTTTTTTGKTDTATKTANIAASSAAAPSPPSAPPSASVDKDDNDKNDKNDDNDDKGPPPPGNGGCVPGRYTWTQTLSEVNLVTPLPPHTRAKQLTVVIARTTLTIRRDDTVLVDRSPLTKPVRTDDCFWTVEDNDKLCITLQKAHDMEWWDSVCVDDAAKIDVTKVEPENSSLNDLDGDTRQTVEKMMFDQRQKALGLPSADEQQKRDTLDKFMQQHPEMDFSRAKIT